MIKNEEFAKRIEDIDNELSKHQIPIYARPLQAIILYQKKYKISNIMLGGPLIGTIIGHEGLHISTSINNWYDKRYGDKLKVDLTRGGVAILISGDVYKLIVPLIFGKAVIAVDGKYMLPHENVENGTMLLNAINYIEGLTNEMASKLSSDEESNILQIFSSASELFNELSKYINKLDLCKSAKSDFDYAVDSLLVRNKSIGHSKWASLQATEKIFKAVLTKNGLKPPKTHNLKTLANKLYDIGYPKISDDLLSTIQCNPSIRYENKSYKLKDAVKANHYSICLSKELLKFKK